jgi:hypothetical protein
MPRSSKVKPRKRQSTPADVERVRKWRQKNPDKYRDYQRQLMRERRAEKN